MAAKFGLPTAAVAPKTHGHLLFYRPCPVCGEQMNRLNYGHDSGVIIDICRKDGTWFDAEELARILAWLRAGGGRHASDEKARNRALGDIDPPQYHSVLEEPHGFLGSVLCWLLGIRD